MTTIQHDFLRKTMQQLVFCPHSPHVFVSTKIYYFPLCVYIYKNPLSFSPYPKLFLILSSQKEEEEEKSPWLYGKQTRVVVLLLLLLPPPQVQQPSGAQAMGGETTSQKAILQCTWAKIGPDISFLLHFSKIPCFRLYCKRPKRSLDFIMIWD